MPNIDIISESLQLPPVETVRRDVFGWAHQLTLALTENWDQLVGALKADLGGAGAGTVTGTGVATRVAFWSAASVLDSDAELFWDNANNRLGVGTSAPTHKLTVRDGEARVLGPDGQDALASVLAHSGTATHGGLLQVGHARGTLASPTIVSSGDLLGMLVFYGYDGNAFRQGVQLYANVDGTPGANDLPSRFVIGVTPDGSVTPVERLRISQDGATELFKTALTATAPLLIRPTISGVTTDIFPSGAYGFITGFYVNSVSTATATGTLNTPGASRIAAQVNHTENAGGSGSSGAFLASVVMNRTGATSYSEHVATQGVAIQNAPSAVDALVYGIGGLCERNNTGAAFAAIVETHNNHNSLGGSGLMILSENGSFRADMAIEVRGNDGWTSVFKYVAEDGSSVPIDINQYGEIYMHPTRSNQASLQIESDETLGPNIKLIATGVTTVHLRASPLTANTFEIVNGAYNRALASFQDSPGTSETSLFLLVNRAGTLSLQRVSMASSVGGMRALQVPA